MAGAKAVPAEWRRSPPDGVDVVPAPTSARRQLGPLVLELEVAGLSVGPLASSGITPQAKCSKASEFVPGREHGGTGRWTWPWSSRATGRA